MRNVSVQELSGQLFAFAVALALIIAEVATFLTIHKADYTKFATPLLNPYTICIVLLVPGVTGLMGLRILRGKEFSQDADRALAARLSRYFAMTIVGCYSSVILILECFQR